MMQEEKRLWNGKPYHSLDYEMKQRFGGKVYRLSLQTGCTCPNRDGRLGKRGCIFCSEGGSGDFAESAALPVEEQIRLAKARIAGKLPKAGAAGYIAYFQSFTNTYGPVSRLEPLFAAAAEHPEILALSIATRPDCLPEEMVDMLARLHQKKPVTIELGLQTIHEETAKFIRRGYGLPVFTDAVKRLKAAGLEVVVHVILGLPGETEDMMEETVSWLASFQTAYGGIDGIKLQLLQILKDTDLGRLYLSEEKEKTSFTDYGMEAYVDLVISLIELLPPEMTVHRLTGDAPKRLLIAPAWSGDKKRVLNLFARRFQERDTWQGQRFCSGS